MNAHQSERRSPNGTDRDGRRLVCNPPRGRRPALQNCTLAELAIDPAYQRAIDNHPSQALVRAIAKDWNWTLCQPLVVANRDGEELFVVDGQHRLAAAHLRGDILDLPCVIISSSGAAQEAETFVALNDRRRPLQRLQVFRAALAAGNVEAVAIATAIERAGLRIGTTTNLASQPPGAVINISGIERCLRQHGEAVLTTALLAIARAWPEQLLRFAGTLFPGIAAICAAAHEKDRAFRDSEDFGFMVEMLFAATQEEWVREIKQALADSNGHSIREAAIHVFQNAWAECCGELIGEAA